MTDQLENMPLTNSSDHSRLPVVFPTLVIGVGGTGVSTLRYLRRRLKDEFGPSADEESRLIQMLGVDTVPLENRSSVEALHQHEYAYIGGYNARRLVENLERFEEIRRWWDWSSERIPLGFISTGAKQLRTIGRLSFYRCFHTYNSRLQAKLNKLGSIEAHQRSHDDQKRPSQDQLNLPHVFVVASVAGGTGAGAFLDIAAHLRNQLEDRARIIGVLVLPSVFEEDIASLLQQQRIRANAYAALKELDYFQSGNEFHTKLPQQDEFKLHGQIFSNVFLVDRSNVSGFQLSRQADIQRMIADAIFEMSVTPIAGHIWEMDVNVTRERRDDRTLAYSALGYSSIAVDERVRYNHELNEHAEMLWSVAFGWPRFKDNSISTAVAEVNKTVRDKAGRVAPGLVEKQANADVVYQTTIRADVHQEILRPLIDNLYQWGIGERGSLAYLNNLLEHYKRYEKGMDDGNPSAGDKFEENLKKQVDAAREKYEKSEKLIRRILRGRESRQEKDLSQKAKAEWDSLQKEYDTLLLIRRAVAPDLVVLINRLINDLNDCSDRLSEAQPDYVEQAISKPDRYPLQRLLEYDYGFSDLEAPEPLANIREAVEKELLPKWVTISDSTDDYPIIQWKCDDSEDVRLDIVAQARRLTNQRLKLRTSLYDDLVSRSLRAPEHTHDLLRDFIRRCVPFVRLDFDRYNYSEVNIEPAYYICMPELLREEFDKQGSLFWALSTGNYEFHPTRRPNHRPDRMDALCVSHGYPLKVFADLPRLFNEYMDEYLGDSPLHLECRWRALMRNHAIHILSDHEKNLQKEREERFKGLCGNGVAQQPGGFGKPSNRRPSSGSSTIDK